MRVLLSLAFLLAALAAHTQAQTEAKLHLNTDPKAKCMDGSQSGFYFVPAMPGNTTKWIVHLEGGGECASEKRCLEQKSTVLGSSKNWPSTRVLGFLNTVDPVGNPDFWTWNHVHVSYCSQDLHSGQHTTAGPDQWGVYFSGRLSFLAVLDTLTTDHGFASATDIILSGDSAGGLGVWYHLDDLKARMPHARVVGAPIAGFYFYAYPYTGVNHTSSGLANFAKSAWPSHYELWDSFIDASCKEGNPSDPSACMLGNNSYPFISADMFITEAQTDQVVLLYHDWVPLKYLDGAPERRYLAEWHHNMTDVALGQVRASDRDGYFNPACFIHTSFGYEGPLIQGHNYFQTVGNWYFGRDGPTKLQDDCGEMCNPTCPKASL